MSDGWIKIWRKSIDSAVFSDPNLWKLWCLCLIKANHKEKWITPEGTNTPVLIREGEFLTGRFELHKEYYQNRRKKVKSPLTVWRWLEKLSNMENLNIKTGNKYSIISINNWDDYQQNEQQMNNRRTTDEQQVNTNKNDKNVKNKRFSDKSEEILLYLNNKRELLGFGSKGFGKSDPNLKHIRARLKNGSNIKELKAVIDCKAKDKYFLDNPKYFNPETLFRPGNFERYLVESETPSRKKQNDLFG